MTSNNKVVTTVVYIPVKQLSVVWTQSQRPYNDKWAQEIADNFDPDMFDPLIVTKPNGEGIYHVIEGQHRRHALEKYAAKFPGKPGDEQAPCRVVAEANPARAAQIWLGVNSGRKAVRPIAGFLVAVVARQEPEVTINNVVIHAGYRVSAAKGPDTIAAVSALRTVYDRHGKQTLGTVLRVLRLVWEGDPQAVSSPLLRGFGIFLHEFNVHVDNKRLANRIGKKWSPYEFVLAAEARKKSTMERLDVAISELLLREYNSGLKEHRLRHKV